MYRYLLFTYPGYYPTGGMEDCILKSNSFDEIKQFIKENRVHVFHDNLYVYDIKENKEIDLRGDLK